MDFFEKFLQLVTKNIYLFIFSIIFLILLFFSINIIFDLKSINPFLYFEF